MWHMNHGEHSCKEYLTAAKFKTPLLFLTKYSGRFEAIITPLQRNPLSGSDTYTVKSL